ncbi:MAG: hypothetical protein WD491_05565 [Balneolales bacterium]
MDKRDTKNLISAIDLLIDKSGELVNKHGVDSKPGSISSKELSSFQRPLSLKTAYSQGHTFVEVAGDQLMAFSRTLKEPIQTIAPFTCGRSVLESCSLAVWLLNNEIDSNERVKRSLAFRFEGMTQQKKLAVSSRTKNGLDDIEIQTDKIIQTAKDLGYQVFCNRKNKITGVATRMPSITELIKNILNKEFDYRLLSAVAHAHHFALAQTSFAKYSDSEDEEIFLYEKSLTPVFILYLCQLTSEVFTNAVRNLTKLHGTFDPEYEFLFKETKDIMDIFYNKLNQI